MPRRQQHHAKVGQLFAGQPAVRGDVRQQARMRSRRQAADCADDGGHRVGRLLGCRVQVVHHRGCRLDRVTVPRWYAEQFADHQRRDRQGERRDEVRRRPGDVHRVERLCRVPLDRRRQRSDPAGPEMAAQQAPVPGVLRRIHVREDPRLRRRGHLMRPVPAYRLMEQFTPCAEARVGKDGLGDAVPGGDPAEMPVRIGQPAQRRSLAQPSWRVERGGPVCLQRPGMIGVHPATSSLSGISLNPHASQHCDPIVRYI